MITYEIDNHSIAFTRQAMNAAHQAFPREFAEWNLALFQKGKAVLPGVTVREIAPVGMTEEDRLGTGKPVRIPAGTGAPAPMPRPGANAPAPAPQPVDGDKYEPVGTVPVVGDRYRLVGWSAGLFETVDRIESGRVVYNSKFDGREDYRLFHQFCGPDSAWRILKRKRPVANALDGARVWRNGTYFVVATKQRAWNWQDGELATRLHTLTAEYFARRIDLTEITGTPAAKEALASLARWMEKDKRRTGGN